MIPGLSPRGVPKKLKNSVYPFNYNDYHNIYANTDHYFKSDSDGWASVHREWLKQLTKLFNWFPDIQFYWLNKENHTTQQKNLHFIEDIWQV